MKKYFVFLVLSIIILAAGCANKTTTTTTTGKTFIGGTDAINFDFLEGSPPSEVFDGGAYPFEVALNLENKGEFDVAKNDIEIRLLGFYAPDFNSPNITKNPDEDLDSAFIDSEGNKMPGTVTYVTFPGFNYKGNLTAGENKFTVRADVCYKYGTKAQANLCVLEDLTELNEKVCKVNEKKTVESSSAPIKIENLDENVAGSEKITFSFEIVHRGTGAISTSGSKCNDDVGYENKVYVTVDSGLSGLTCSGFEGGTATTGYITLYGGKRLIRCTQDTTGLTGDFEKKLNVNLLYDYKEHKDIGILVKHTTQ